MTLPYSSGYKEINESNVARYMSFADRALMCKECPLSTTACNKAFDRMLMFYSDCLPLPIVIVGMSPAYCEDRTGEPLVGGWEALVSHCGRCVFFEESEKGPGCFDYFLHKKTSYKNNEQLCKFPGCNGIQYVDNETYIKRLKTVVPAMMHDSGLFKPSTAGMLLDTMLKKANIIRTTETAFWEDAHNYIDEKIKVPLPNCATINTTLCRSFTTTDGKVDNRDPSVDEIASCEPLIREFINIVEPKVIITLGAIATSQMIGTFGKFSQIIRREHASLFGPPVVPLYHPSYYLHRWEDSNKDMKDDILVLQYLYETYVKNITYKEFTDAS